MPNSVCESIQTVPRSKKNQAGPYSGLVLNLIRAIFELIVRVNNFLAHKHDCCKEGQ